jgi:hypothetical protein
VKTNYFNGLPADCLVEPNQIAMTPLIVSGKKYPCKANANLTAGNLRPARAYI